MIRKIAIYIIISVVSFLTASCASGGKNSPSEHFRRALNWDAVALENVEFTPQWQESALDEPFIIGGADEEIYLKMKVEDPQKWTVNPLEYRETQTAGYWDTHVPNYVINPQGEQTDIEMKLITKDGRIFELYPFAANNEDIRFEFKYYHGVGEKVPDNTVFTKIKVRSSNPFKCQRLIWSRYTRM